MRDNNENKNSILGLACIVCNHRDTCSGFVVTRDAMVRLGAKIIIVAVRKA